MRNKVKKKSFSSLVFMPISTYADGCIAEERFYNGYSIIVWGGANGQTSDGVETYDVRLLNRNNKPVRIQGRAVLRQQSPDDVAGIMEHFQRRR